MEPSELFSYNGAVEELELDDSLREHLTERGFYAKHNVTLAEILEAHQIAPKYFVNASAGRAPIIMVGRTADGRILCIPIEPTGRNGVWRPVTAFEGNSHHRQRYHGEE